MEPTSPPRGEGALAVVGKGSSSTSSSTSSSNEPKDKERAKEGHGSHKDRDRDREKGSKHDKKVRRKREKSNDGDSELAASLEPSSLSSSLCNSLSCSLGPTTPSSSISDLLHEGGRSAAGSLSSSLEGATVLRDSKGRRTSSLLTGRSSRKSSCAPEVEPSESPGVLSPLGSPIISPSTSPPGSPLASPPVTRRSSYGSPSSKDKEHRKKKKKLSLPTRGSDIGKSAPLKSVEEVDEDEEDPGLGDEEPAVPSAVSEPELGTSPTSHIHNRRRSRGGSTVLSSALSSGGTSGSESSSTLQTALSTFWSSLVHKLTKTTQEDGEFVLDEEERPTVPFIEDTLAREGDLIAPAEGWVRDEFHESTFYSAAKPLSHESSPFGSPTPSSPDPSSDDPLNSKTRFYERHFYGKEHGNYIGFADELGVVVLSLAVAKDSLGSVVREEDFYFSDPDDKPLSDGERTPAGARVRKTKPGMCIVRGLLRTKKEDKRAWFVEMENKAKNEKRLVEKILKRLQVCAALNPKMLRKIDDTSLHKELLDMESLQIASIKAVRNHKIGVVLQKDGQQTEEDILSNNEPNADLEEFLEFLGKKIALQGWTGYAGGLDVEKNETGTHSIFAEWKDHKLMFHVASLLPFSKSNSQQVERKRYIGNDVCTIVFQDSSTTTPYSPKIFSSHVIHVVALVRKVSKPGEPTCYKVTFSSKQGVPSYGPRFLGSPLETTYEKSEHLRDMLFAKLVTGEQEAVYAPEFIARLERSRNTALRAMALAHNQPLNGSLWQS